MIYLPTFLFCAVYWDLDDTCLQIHPKPKPNSFETPLHHRLTSICLLLSIEPIKTFHFPPPSLLFTPYRHNCPVLLNGRPRSTVLHPSWCRVVHGQVVVFGWQLLLVTIFLSTIPASPPMMHATTAAIRKLWVRRLKWDGRCATRGVFLVSL